MTHSIGLDAYSKTCTAVVMDLQGKILTKAQFATTKKNLINFVKEVKHPRSLAFEEMNISKWLFVLLKEHVDEITVCCGQYVRTEVTQINGLCGYLERLF